MTYYRNSVGVLLIYDTTNYVSFTHVTSWLNEARAQIQPYQSALLLVGTKIDRESERQVSGTTFWSTRLIFSRSGHYRRRKSIRWFPQHLVHWNLFESVAQRSRSIYNHCSRNLRYGCGRTNFPGERVSKRDFSVLLIAFIEWLFSFSAGTESKRVRKKPKQISLHRSMWQKRIQLVELEAVVVVDLDSRSAFCTCLSLSLSPCWTVCSRMVSGSFSPSSRILATWESNHPNQWFASREPERVSFFSTSGFVWCIYFLFSNINLSIHLISHCRWIQSELFHHLLLICKIKTHRAYIIVFESPRGVPSDASVIVLLRSSRSLHDLFNQTRTHTHTRKET
jgi:hypothetical protein